MNTRDRHVPNVLAPFEPPYATVEQRREHAEGLRAMADWLETSRFPIPRHALTESLFHATLEVHSVSYDDEGFVRRAGSAARLIGGRVEKGTLEYSSDFKLSRHFGGGVTLRYQIARDAVCEAKEVVVDEEREVPEDDVAASSLRFHIEELEKDLRALPTTTRTIPVTKTEYVCPDSLLGGIGESRQEHCRNCSRARDGSAS